MTFIDGAGDREVIWLGIFWLACAASTLEMMYRAPELPWHD